MATSLEAGSVVANFVANTKNFDRGVRNAGRKLEDFSSKSTKRLGQVNHRMKSVGRGMENAGGKMSAFSGAVSAGVGGALKMFIGFDDQMRTVQAITGSTEEEMQKLTDTAQELGSTTRFSARESAEAMEMLGRAGFDTNEIMEATPGILDLAAASGENLGQTADTASDILSAFGLEAKESGRVADVLAEAAGNSNTTVGQLGEAMKFAAPVANDFGASLEETSAIAGVMADNGIKASNAGTALRAGFQRLSAPTDDARAVLKQLGIETTNAEGEMRSMTDILFEYKNANEEMTEQQQLANNKTVFGAEASSAFSTVLNAGEDDVRSFTSSLQDSGGAAEKMAETIEGGSGGAFRELASQVETTATNLGNLFEPMLVDTIIPAVSSLNDEIKKLTNWFKSQDQATQDLITKMLMFAVAIGPVLLVVGKLIGFITSVAGATSTLFGILKPIGLFLTKSLFPLLLKVVAFLGGPVTIAIAAVIAAGTLLITNWETVKKNGLTLWRAIKRLVGDAVNAIKEFFLSGVNYVTKQAGRLSRTVQRWFRQLKTGALYIFETLVKGVKNFFLGMYRGVKKIAMDIFNAVNIRFKKIKRTVERIILRVKQIVGNVFSNIWSTINHHVTRAWETISNIFSEIWGTINHHITNAKNTVSDIFSNIWGTVNHWVTEVWGTVNHVFTSLRDTVFEKFDSWEGHIRHAIFKIRKFFDNNSARIQDAITGPFNQAKDWIKEIFSGLNIGDIFGGMIRGLPNGQKILNQLPAFASGVRDFVGGAAIVNERGPEVRFMPDGTTVIPASLSENMMNKMQPSGGGVNIESITINENADTDKFFRMLDERQRFVDSGLTE